MELKVKEKLIDGKRLKGIINSNLTEVAPFIFQNIYVYKYYLFGYDRYYYICEREDGTCSLYDDYGKCLLDYSEGYKKLHILKCSNEVIAEKDGKKGILKKHYIKDTDSSKLEEAYPFGKCDEIEELKDGTVRLIKHTKSSDRVGYWYHKKIQERIEPKYLTYDYVTISPEGGVRHPMGCIPTDHIEKNKLTLNVEMVNYSKLKNKRPVFGIKQKVVTRADSYTLECNFEDFLPAEYSNIKYDPKSQIFFLEKIVDGKIKKGFIGVTFDWHFGLCNYPNLRKEVDIPCIYDEIEIIDDNHALLKKDSKYGLTKFSFGKSNGDTDLYNRKKFSRGYLNELVPCIYYSIEKAGPNFIGRIGDEEQIITNIIDKDTKETKIIQGNYKKIVRLNDSIFLCDLEDGKKEVIFFKYFAATYLTYERQIFAKISPCDNAEIIKGESQEKYLLKVVNGNVIDVYYEDEKTHNIEKLEENISSISYNHEKNVFIIIKQNGHIVYTNHYGQTLFSTEALGLEPKNLSVEYLNALGMYKVTNDGLIKIYMGSCNKLNLFENRVFNSFEVKQAGRDTFCGYVELTKDGIISKLSRIDRNYMKEIELLKGNFKVEDIVLNGRRIIISHLDSKTGEKKFGVIESQEGNVCIDCSYNSIQYDHFKERFVCSTDNEVLSFDNDGFIIDTLSTPNILSRTNG